MLWPVPVDSELTTGDWRLTFKGIQDISELANRELPLTFRVPILGKGITLSKIDNNATAGRSVMQLTVLENPIPVALVVEGILVVLGLGIAYMALEKVEKIINNPAADIALIGAGGLAILAVTKKIFK